MRRRSARSATAAPARSTCTRCCRVPPEILALGPTDPAALAWLTEHWGTTDRLRKVHQRAKPRPGRRLPVGHAVIGYGFFTHGDTPYAAMARLGTHWPALRFVVRLCSLD